MGGEAGASQLYKLGSQAELGNQGLPASGPILNSFYLSWKSGASQGEKKEQRKKNAPARCRCQWFFLWVVKQRLAG